MASRATQRQSAASLARAREARREQARSNQRVALALAMIDSIAEHGYGKTTVADVCSYAGVSCKTVYQPFSNREECFLTTYDQISARAILRVEQAYQEADGWPGRVEAAIRALFEAAIENPGAVRLVLIEISALGPVGIERREQSIVHYERFLHDALRLAPGKGAFSDTVAKAVIGGLNRVLYRRVIRGERAELPAVIPDLVAWFTSYYPPPVALLAEPPVAKSAKPTPRPLPEGGPAPGTLAPEASLNGRRGLPGRDHNVSRSLVVHSQRERILDAVANLTAVRGYAELRVEDIAERAAVSLQAFYEHFADKEDAFLVAYEVGHGKSLALVERAHDSAPDWPSSVRAGVTTLLGFLASEPAFAHMALVDALVATPRTAERANKGIVQYLELLAPGFDEAPDASRPPAVSTEAIARGINHRGPPHTIPGPAAPPPRAPPCGPYF